MNAIKGQIKKSFGQIINSVYPFYWQQPGIFVKKGIPVIVIGGIIGTLGIIFHLQGQSLVGPESSFMYSNPDWITYGIQIILVGLVIIGIGATLGIMKKS